MNLQKILIVDNDLSVLSLLTGFLSDTSYEVYTAKDGLECLDILRKEEIDVAVIEIHIEGIDGIDLLKIAKTEQIQTALICMAHSGNLALGEAATKAGAVSLLDKPIEKDAFLTKIEEYISQTNKWKAWLESFLDDNYSNPHLKFEDVMNYFRFSKSYGYALFKKHLGNTFREALREVRVREAIILLEEMPYASITEIANSCGFRSPSRLNEAFRRLCGVSPRIYRKNGHKLKSYVPKRKINYWSLSCVSKLLDTINITDYSCGYFGLAGINVAVYAEDSKQLGWLKKYLSSMSIENDIQSYSYTVVLIHKREILEAIRNAISNMQHNSKLKYISFYQKRQARMYSFGTNSEVVIPIQSSGRTVSLLLSYPKDEIYIRMGNKIFLVSDCENREATELSRLVRDIITKNLFHNGWFMLHASTVTNGRESMAFCGDKGVGKTSIMLEMLKNGWSYVSNDRILLNVTSQKAMAFNWPTIIPVMWPLVEKSVELSSAIECSDFPTYPQFQFWKTFADKERFEKFKVCFTEKELTDAFNASVFNSVNLTHIFFIERSNKGSGLIDCSFKVSEKLVNRHVLDLSDDGYPDVFRFSSLDNETYNRFIYEAIKTFISQVPCYLVRGNDTTKFITNYLCTP